jgi:hypothetical protein
MVRAVDDVKPRPDEPPLDRFPQPGRLGELVAAARDHEGRLLDAVLLLRLPAVGGQARDDERRHASVRLSRGDRDRRAEREPRGDHRQAAPALGLIERGAKIFALAPAEIVYSCRSADAPEVEAEDAEPRP